MLLIMASPIPVCDHKLPRCNGKTCMSLIDHHSTKVPDCHMKIVFALCKASLRKSVIGVSYSHSLHVVAYSGSLPMSGFCH